MDPRKEFRSQRPETHEEWQARMGGEVLAVVRSGLYLDFRFLDMALSALTPAPDERCRVLATDGQMLYYQPARLLQLYQQNPKYLNRLYLHVVFHCVFRHLWLKGRREPQLWSLACDIAVENVIDSLNRASVKRPLTYVRQNAYQQITAEEKVVAAAPAYRWLTRQTPGVLRRIIRDYKYRGVSAQESIHRWPSVRAGEERWIFPYQENADAMFNSAMLYELAVIKQQAEPLLEQVPENCEEYAEAHRLLKFLRYFHAISYRQLAPTSLLREFLGGSSFKY